MPRVASLIASSTEFVCALNLQHLLVARSHECDHPPDLDLPQVTRPRLDPSLPSREIDRQIRERLRDALSIYEVDGDALRATRPDVILTQTLCDVCAVSQHDVERALAESLGCPDTPTIVPLAPASLSDVFDDAHRIAAALGHPDAAPPLVDSLRRRLDALRQRTHTRPPVRVALLEWIDPLMAAGHWTPQLAEIAGGHDVFGHAGQHAPPLAPAALADADPEAILVIPCGFDRPRTRREVDALTALPGWSDLRAVRTGRVALADGNALFNRPGPRLVESAEVIAEFLHPEEFPPRHRGTHWELL